MSTPNKPKDNSIKKDISRLHKGAARKLLFDDYSSKDHIEWEGNFKMDKSAVKSKATVKLNRGGKTIQANLTDESQLDFKLGKRFNYRVKVKPKAIQSHLDLDQYYCNWSMLGYGFRMWTNPYLVRDVSRSFTDRKTTIGARFDVNEGMMTEDDRIQISCKDGDWNADFTHNGFIKYKGFVWNHLWKSDIKNVFTSKTKKISVEYSKDKWSTSVEMERNGEGRLFDFTYDKIDLGLSYKKNDKTSMGIWTSTDLNTYDTTATAGVQNKVNDNVTVKAKINSNKDVELFSQYKPCDYFSVGTSILTSLDAQRNSELYNNGAKVGLKVKFDN